MRDHQSLRRSFHRQSHPALKKGLRLAVQRGGLGKVTQQIDVDVLGAALGQYGIDRAVGFDQAGRLSGADPQHNPVAALPDCLRGLDEACLAVGGVKDEVDTPVAGQLRDFRRDVITFVIENVMRAGLPRQCDRLGRAAAADDQSGPQRTRRHLHGESSTAFPPKPGR
jgi:hypothetical protein